MKEAHWAASAVEGLMERLRAVDSKAVMLGDLLKAVQVEWSGSTVEAL